MEIKVEDYVAEMIAAECEQVGCAPDDLANRLLRNHLEMREIDRIRSRLIPIAEAAGCFTDEDFIRVVDEVRRTSPAPGA